MDHRLVRAAVIAAGMLAFAATSGPVGATPRGAALAASDHTCARTLEGGVSCWGDNSAGGLGDGTTSASNQPVDVVGLGSDVSAIATGDRYSCALLTGAGVRCWGYNEFGQLGDGTNANRQTPVDVVGLSAGITELAARGEHTCALASEVVRCWGANINGQLGDGTTTSSASPVDVAGLAGVASIAAGGEHTCAIVRSGGLKCWGWNKTGQLGIGTTTDSSTPVDVAGLNTRVAAVAAGGRHTCALTTSGGVRCWGFNDFGQLGDGTTTGRLTPVEVSGLSEGVIGISAGGNFTCALKTDGSVVCWGSNAAGQLGDGTTLDRHTPADVTGPAMRATFIVAGYYHVCALTSEGLATCWGGNDAGQLGNGSTTDSSRPTVVRDTSGAPFQIVAPSNTSTPVPVLVALAVGVSIIVILALGWSLTLRRRQDAHR